jgi:hypothetical protein
MPNLRVQMQVLAVAVGAPGLLGLLWRRGGGALLFRGQRSGYGQRSVPCRPGQGSI